MDLVNRTAVRRGDIWLVRLDPTVGNEIQKTRPCLIVSPNLMNRFLGTVTLLPMTSGGKPEPFRIESSFADKPGLILGDQIRSVSKERLIKLLGQADAITLSGALGLLREMFEE